uniref:A-kinase anchor protein 14 n=1 Tax=Strigamia maritima TaxID=126957 RepID=T1IJ11_STRMM
MFNFPSDSTSSEDEKKEPNYYKNKNLIKSHKVPVKRESDAKEQQLDLKFKKDKFSQDPAVVATNELAQTIVIKAITDTYNALVTERELGVDPLPYQTCGEVWMTVGEFSQKKAREHLEDFVISWQLPSEWLYCIRFLEMKKNSCDDVYTYQLIWSIPTQEQPIPIATASVYFSFEVSFIKPRYYPVNMFFFFECSRLVHWPGKTIIKEHMLRSIIQSKLTISNMITF